MPALPAKTPSLVVANARHSLAMAALCASIENVLTRLSDTVEKPSTSEANRSNHEGTY
jgi:hypothetical protein